MQLKPPPTPIPLPPTHGGTGTSTTFTAGSIVFIGAAGVYAQDNGNLFWDNANDRLGIGTATPGNHVHVLFSEAILNSIVQAQVYIRNSLAAAQGHATITLDKGATNAVAAFNFCTGTALEWDVGVYLGNIYFREWTGGAMCVVFETGAPADSLRVKASGQVECSGGPLKVKSYTVAGLPAAGTAARVAFASNGRKAGEGGGAGTGVLVFDDGTAWRACDTGATVAA